MRRTLTNKNENIRIYNKEVAIPKKEVTNTKSTNIPIKKPFLDRDVPFWFKKFSLPNDLNITHFSHFHFKRDIQFVNSKSPFL